jgi:predicted transcriptional regulator
VAANLPKAQRLEHMRRAWSLAVEGKTQAEIASELGVSQGWVSRCLAEIARKRSEHLTELSMMHTLMDIERQHQAWRESMEAFQRSKRARKSATKKTMPGLIPTTSPAGTTTAAPSVDATTTQVVERDGEPAWLREARESIRLKHELLAAHAPKLDATAKDAGAGNVADALIEAERRDKEYQCIPPSNDSLSRLGLPTPSPIPPASAS